MSFTNKDKQKLEERMSRLVTLWDSERKDHYNKCRTLDTAFREATEVFNALGPLLARVEAAEKCADYGCPKHISTIPRDCDWCRFYEAWRKSKGAPGDE